MSRLEHASEQPYTTRSSRELARSGRFALVVDEIDMPDGSQHQNRWFRATSAAFIVPVFDDLTTVLVRQWRHPWRETSWEVPAGTLEEGEEPLAGARRELEERPGWSPVTGSRSACCAPPPCSTRVSSSSWPVTCARSPGRPSATRPT